MNLRWRSSKKIKAIALVDLLRVSWTLETGLKSGRDWISVLKWIAGHDHEPKVCIYFSKLCHDLRLDAAEKCLQLEKNRFHDLMWVLFIEILLQANRGTQNLAQLFRSFSQMGGAVVKIKQKEASLLFIPKFQSITSVLIAGGFTIGLPLLAPDVFPTFISLKRWDLFLFGVALIVIGFILLQWMCLKPRRALAPLLSHTFFFYFLSVYIESGLDLATSWYKAGDSVQFSNKMKAQLFRQGIQMESLDEFLDSLRQRLKAPWPEILSGLIWSRHSGVGVAQFLKEISQREAERSLLDWEDKIRKLTMTSLLPLGLLIFPGTLYLLVGPQFMELIQL